MPASTRLTLQPFTASTWLEPLSLTAQLQATGSTLQLTYCLHGPWSELIQAPAVSNRAPERRDGLWQSTCLEAFWGQPGEPGYWELNVACNGDWNLYRLDGYRQGLRPEARIAALPVVLERQPQQLQLSVSFSLEPLGLSPAALDYSITAVLAQASTDNIPAVCSYWALRHTGPEADFHRRDSFLRLLWPQTSAPGAAEIG